MSPAARMTIGEKRRLFTSLLAGLIRKAEELGLVPQIDEVRRSPEVAAEYARQGIGIKRSLHVLGLAVDLDLGYMEGPTGRWVYLTETEDYQELGQWWEAQHELACWGGRFKRRDGRHFSITHGGVR